MLSVPVCAVAWPVAILTGRFPLTFVVFVGVYVATKLESRAGAADGKLMVGLAACAPLALGIGILIEALVFVILHCRKRPGVAIPGALWLYVGALFATMALHTWPPHCQGGWC